MNNNDWYDNSTWYEPLHPETETAGPERGKKKKITWTKARIVGAVVLVLLLIAGTSLLFAQRSQQRSYGFYWGEGDNTPWSADGRDGTNKLPDSSEEFFDSFYTETDTDTAKINIPAVTYDESFSLTLEEPGEQELTLNELYDACAPSIVAIYGYVDGQTGYYWGSGVVLSEDGLILTNTHVVNGCDRATVKLADNSEYEAKLVGEVVEVASSAADNDTYVPKDFTFPADADYFHITTNNTIYGTEIRKEPDSPVLMVADMSSDVLSRPVDVSKYAIIYGGAQKNLSMAGVTFVIVKEDALGKVSRAIPTMLDYRTHIAKGSMFNTPPVVPVYCAMKTLEWIKEQGGVKAMDKLAHERAEILYGEIDRNKLFRGTVKEEDRSLMNICFVMNDEYKELEADFMKFATEKGMVGIKGHRSVGGFRASCYNAMPVEGVKALVEAMKEFEAQH